MNVVEKVGHNPREIEPRPCEWCGLTIDQHQMVDEGEGPEFFCEEVSADAADMVRRWEEADARDRWRHTGEPRPPAPGPEGFPRPQPYRMPQSTIDAFWVVLGRGDPVYLANWLSQHPRDTAHLHEVWGRTCSIAAA